MPQPITPEMIAAWRTLQEFAKGVHNQSHRLAGEAARAVDVLDNSDFMVPIERAEEES